MSAIIAIANEKGGVAKTTTTMSLGGAFVELGHNVLLIDLDPQANLTLATGLQPAKVRRSSADLLLNAAAPLSISRETELPGLDIIPANGEMGLAERFLPIRANYTSILSQALAGLSLYDFILIDCPPSLGAVTTNALTAADRLIIPTQAEYFSAFALRNMLALVKKVSGQDNPNLKYQILITLYDQRNRIHRVLREQIETNFAGQVFKTAIQIDTRLRESAVAGMPVTHFAKNSRGAEQYRWLAQELTEDVQETAAQSA